MTEFKFSQKRICAAPSSYCMSQHAMVNTLQYRLSYTWQAIVVQSFKRLTWSNIIHEFSISPPICIFFTSSTPLPGRSTDILKTNTLSFDCPGNRLPWTNLKAEWSLSAIILSIVPIPLRKKRFDPDTKLRQFEDAGVLNLSMTTSKDEPTK